MAKAKVIWLEEARIQLRDIATFHMLRVGPNSARNITNRILSAVDRLQDFPEMGAVPPFKLVAEAGFRMLVVGEYLCFYRTIGDQVNIIQIVHGSTDYIQKLLQ